MAKRWTLRKRKNEVPTIAVILVIIVGAVALAFPLSLWDNIAQSGIGSSGNIAGNFFRGGDALAGKQTAVGSITCEDSDGGANLAVKGTCSIGPLNKVDYCWDSESVVEYSCKANKQVQNIYNCLNWGYKNCLDGRCI